MRSYCAAQQITGSILLAEEGINGTIAGTRQAIDNVLANLRADSRLADLEHKESYTDETPFRRMKVRLKKEIAHLGVPDIDPTKEVGTYIDPTAWNDLISAPDVLFIDLIPNDTEMCPHCKKILTATDKAPPPHFKQDIYCPDCYHTLTPERIASKAERLRQLALTKQRTAKK